VGSGEARFGMARRIFMRQGCMRRGSALFGVLRYGKAGYYYE